MITGPSIITDGLVFHLDAANPKSYVSGNTTWNDLTDNDNNGILENGPTFETENGGSIVFDGNNDYVEVLSNGNDTVFDTQEFTIDVWCKIQFDGSNEVLWSYDYTSHNPPYYSQQLRIDNANDNVFFGYNHSGTFINIQSSSNVINNNTWHNVLATKSQTESKIYVDGEEVGSSSYSPSTINYYNQEIWIGRGNWSTSWLKGNINSVKFYNRALDSEEVAQNYNELKHRFGL